MLQIAKWRILLVAVSIVLGLAFAAPNVLPQKVRDSLPGFLPKQAIHLGLDLRGGSHLLYQVDVDALRHQLLENVSDSMASSLRDAEPRISFSGRAVVGDAARVRVLDPADMSRAMEIMAKVNRDAGFVPTGGNLAITQGADGLIEARLTPEAVRLQSRNAAQQSIEVIRKRIDPSGTSEVSITRQGDERIVVQAPGMSDPAELKALIGKTALLTFHMVDDTANVQEALQLGRVPPGSMLVQPYPEIGDHPDVVRRRPSLTGERLVDASPTVDSQTQEWVLSFRLDSRGSQIFCGLSTQNVGKRFAILLDGQVLTAPVIRSPICGGRGQIEGNFTVESANELSVMLRAGALPAPLTVEEERSVGPGLGKDSINAGAIAGLIAAFAVVAFMVLFYGGFGAMACIALAVNIMLILASMSTIGAALTLPGIAGLVLTLGMAVDSNVLIYERMREEQAHGRGAAMAIDAGFSRAMVTILDANITTIGAAAILFSLGKGPVQGFAWTLSIGCVTTVFTAVFVTQLMVAAWYRLVRPKQLPI